MHCGPRRRAASSRTRWIVATLACATTSACLLPSLRTRAEVGQADAGRDAADVTSDAGTDATDAGRDAPSDAAVAPDVCVPRGPTHGGLQVMAGTLRAAAS